MNRHSPTVSYFDRRSIRYPLARLIIVTVLVAMGLALLSDAVIMLDNVRRDIHRSLISAANAVGTAANAAVVFKDARVAEDTLRMLEAYPEVRAAALYTQDGVRLAGYGDTHLLPPLAPAPDSNLPDIELLADSTILHLPIMVDEDAAGTIYLHAALNTYWRTYMGSIATTLLVTISTGVVALVLAMRFLDRIILPVRRLAEAARDARMRNDFTPRSILAPDNEIGDLVSNFNALLSEVETGRRTLRRQHEELEHLVQERTAELLDAKEAADAANAAKSRFLAAASHDLRQPIHAMRLFLETLGETPLNDEQRRIANYLSLSTRNLSEILNSLLDVSKLDSGMVKPQSEAIPADVLINHIEAEFAPLALAKNLRFKLFFPTRELVLYTDARLLASLLRNLIDNAIKYTDSGGILVAFRRRRDSALIQVWDTGIGIAPDHLDLIFDEYFQVGNPQRDRSRGLGLGLANAKRVASLLGCRIYCHSRTGRGSLFELSIPLAPEQSHPAGEGLTTKAGQIPSHLNGRRVVVVEDDPLVAKAAELALSTHGLKVSTYPSSEHAIADPQAVDADFFIVDYRLPGLNGIQFMEEMEERAKRLPRGVLLTGDVHGGTAGAASHCPWKVLQKPVDPSLLLAEISKQLQAAETTRYTHQ